jgi:hypothetical protein
MILEFTGGVKQPLAVADVPELEDQYPEATMFGELPAFAFFIRHAEDIGLTDISVKTLGPDVRKPLYAVDVRGLDTTQAPKP